MIRWGVIGAGDVVERKSGPGFQQAPDSALLAVMRRNADAAADFAKRHGVPKWYDEADALLADPEVDAIYVATPPDSHRDYALAAAAAGKPVYVEKPMARTAAECDQMIAACADAGVPLFVAYYRRAMPRFVTAADLVRSGRLGDVHSVIIRNQRPPDDPSQTIPWRVNPEVSGGGHFVDLASHTLDWLDHVFGPLLDVAGGATGPDGPVAETTVTMSFGWAGIRGAGVWDFTAAEAIDVIEIVGTQATLAFSSFGGEPLRVSDATGTTTIDAPYPDVVQLPLISNVVDSLLGRAEPISTGESARRTAQVIDTVLASHRESHGLSYH